MPRGAGTRSETSKHTNNTKNKETTYKPWRKHAGSGSKKEKEEIIRRDVVVVVVVVVVA